MAQDRNSLINKIKEEVRRFEQEDIQVFTSMTEEGGGVNFNQFKTIGRIYHYIFSQFESGEEDAEGFKKYFLNISRTPDNVYMKEIDFDTRHVRLLTTGGGNTNKTWLAERDLKHWMRKRGFGKDLNEIFYRIPKFGSHVIKYVKDTVYHVDLRNFWIQQDADSIEEAEFLGEKHNYSRHQFVKEARKRNWNNFEKVLEQNPEDTITVYERYGLFSEADIDPENGDPYNVDYYKVIVGETFDQENEKGEIEKEAETVHLTPPKKIDTKDLPYWEFHGEKIPGRWLGLGVYEILFDPQMRTNELINLQVKASYWASLLVFQTRDENANRNLLNDASVGDVMYFESPIQQVDTTERNLSAYNTEHNLWRASRDEQLFTSDIIRGESPKSGVPLGSSQLASASSGKYYKFIRQNLAMSLKQFFIHSVLPKFEEDSNEEHYIKLAGEDLERYKKVIIQNKIRERWFQWVKNNGRIPTREEKEILATAVKESQDKKSGDVGVPENFYKADDLVYDLQIMITGESVDTRVQSSNLQMALQAITQDETLLTDPVKREIFEKILEMGGVNLDEVQNVEQSGKQDTVERLAAEMRGQQEGAAPQRGGGVSIPNVPQQPTGGEQQTQEV